VNNMPARPYAGASPQGGAPTLAVRRLGIDTLREPVVYMRPDCHVCRAEGFRAQSRVEVTVGARSVVATLNVVTSDILEQDEAGLSEVAWFLLDAHDDDVAAFAHPRPVESMSHVRAKIYGSRLGREAFASIIGDVVQKRYSDIQLAAFVTACAGNRLDLNETTALTNAMIDVGARIRWDAPQIVDKHCVGGLPGNRTTLLVVPIVAAFGLIIPKTSSRAITSPSGTADAMETLAPVDLDLPALRRVVAREGGCIAWGGAVSLSPADDILIGVERPLDLDSEGQLVASVLSKKAAAGATDVVIDIPVGPTAKVRNEAAAHALAQRLAEVGTAVGLHVRNVVTDGSQPVGRGIGPALEARDVLSVLKGESDAPADLRDRALHMAGEVISLSREVVLGKARALAEALLADGSAWRKFQAICEAQGGMRKPPIARHTHPVAASRAGRIIAFDNRRLARAAKLAGAPGEPAAGMVVHVKTGTYVEAGQPLFTLHAMAPGELGYALDYVASQPDIVEIGE